MIKKENNLIFVFIFYFILFLVSIISLFLVYFIFSRNESIFQGYSFTWIDALKEFFSYDKIGMFFKTRGMDIFMTLQIPIPAFFLTFLLAVLISYFKFLFTGYSFSDNRKGALERFLILCFRSFKNVFTLISNYPGFIIGVLIYFIFYEIFKYGPDPEQNGLFGSFNDLKFGVFIILTLFLSDGFLDSILVNYEADLERKYKDECTHNDRASGKSKTVLFFYTILSLTKNNLITIILSRFPAVFGMTLVIEIVFDWHGIGRYLFINIFRSTGSTDMLTLAYICILTSFLILLVNLLNHIRLHRLLKKFPLVGLEENISL